MSKKSNKGYKDRVVDDMVAGCQSFDFTIKLTPKFHLNCLFSLFS